MGLYWKGRGFKKVFNVSFGCLEGALFDGSSTVWGGFIIVNYVINVSSTSLQPT